MDVQELILKDELSELENITIKAEGHFVMNDRFKFRVWDGRSGVFLRGVSCSDLSKGINFITEEVIVEQCTGLKDKNGVLIFEGDIFKHPFFKNGYMQWHNEEACFVMAFADRSPTHQWYYADLEVIGNIHENPELLK